MPKHKNKEEPIFAHSVKEWVNFSIEKRNNFAEVRRKILEDGVENVCISYICQQTKMSTAEITELFVLSSGILDSDSYDQQYIPTLVKLLKLPVRERKHICRQFTDYMNLGIRPNVDKEYSELPRSIMKSIANRFKKDHGIIDDKIDWYNILLYQEVDEEFLELFRDEILSQKLSSNLYNKMAG